MWFQKRQDVLTPPALQSLAVGSAPVRVELDRTFPIESIKIVATMVVSGAIATATAEGLTGLIRRVNLTVADGVRTRSVVDCSGNELLEYFIQTMGNLDSQTRAAVGATAAATYVVTYTIPCSHPQLEDPVGSSFMLPVQRYPNNPVLQIDLASQAEIDSNGTPTFAAVTSIDLIINRRQVIVEKFPYLDWDLTVQEQVFAASVTDNRLDLPTPGSYTGILLRGYTSAAARGDISGTSKLWRVESLGVVYRRFKLEKCVRIENEESMVKTATTQPFTGSYYLDFLTDKNGQATDNLGSVLDANIPTNSGAKIQLISDITGGAGVKLRVLTHRVYGDLRSLKFV